MQMLYPLGGSHPECYKNTPPYHRTLGKQMGSNSVGNKGTNNVLANHWKTTPLPHSKFSSSISFLTLSSFKMHIFNLFHKIIQFIHSTWPKHIHSVSQSIFMEHLLCATQLFVPCHSFSP